MSEPVTDIDHDDFNRFTLKENFVKSRYISLSGIFLPHSDIFEEDVANLYKRDSLVHRIIFKEIEDIFGIPPRVISDDDNLKEAIESFLFGKLKFWHVLADASLHAYLDGTALVFLNYGHGLASLSSAPKKVSNIVHAGVIYKRDISDFTLDEDLTSSTFNEVVNWKVTLGTVYDVHHTRVCHVLFDTIYGDPMGISRISSEYDSHIYRRIIVDSIVSAVHQNSEGIRAFELPPDCTVTERDYLEKNINDLRTRSDMIIPHGTDIHHPGPTIANPKIILDHLMETCTSMPYQILTGTQAGAVTGSETNLLTYYLEIDKKRQRILHEMITDKLFFLQEVGFLPEGDFDLDWGSIYVPDALDEANVFLRKTTALLNLLKSNTIDADKVRDMLSLD